MDNVVQIAHDILCSTATGINIIHTGKKFGKWSLKILSVIAATEYRELNDNKLNVAFRPELFLYINTFRVLIVCMVF